ncbi:hypothetical protein Btru_053301 [Bulinus truncatus]|nr:hypothetical protein Btru_053301 [Bulinus truncatus]
MSVLVSPEDSPYKQSFAAFRLFRRTPSSFPGTKGHSVYNKRSYAMPVRRQTPTIAAPRLHTSFGNVRHDYGIEDSIQRADYLSNAVLEDTYDAATRSRGKDHELLRSVNAAIVSTEQHISPRAASVSRRVRASTVPPLSRPYPGQQVQQQQYIKVAAPLLAKQSPAGPVFVMLVPNSSFRPINNNIIASKPVVLSQGESPWSVRARAVSVPPADYRSVRGASVPPPRTKRSAAPLYKPPEPLLSSKLWAHTPVRPDLLRSVRAKSLEPTRRASAYESPFKEPLPTATLWAHRPRVLRSDAPRIARARVENRKSYPGALSRAASEPKLNFERPSDYYYLSVPDVKERALSRYLYAHRGKYGPETKPPRPSLGNFPQVYVPWNGPGPSNRSKAAIIGSRLETEGAKKPRRPRSEFAANKLREMKRDEIERKYKF